MRVYVPTTVPGLRAVVTAGAVGPAPVTAFAVTPALREWYVEGEEEELEYAALTEAARASMRLIGLDPAAPPRRVVLALDVPDAGARPEPELDRAVVRLLEPVPWTAVASVLADDGDDDVVRTAVRAGADAAMAADLGDDDAQFVVDSVDDHELLWFATQEAPDLRG